MAAPTLNKESIIFALMAWEGIGELISRSAEGLYSLWRMIVPSKYDREHPSAMVRTGRVVGLVAISMIILMFCVIAYLSGCR